MEGPPSGNEDQQRRTTHKPKADTVPNVDTAQPQLSNDVIVIQPTWPRGQHWDKGDGKQDLEAYAPRPRSDHVDPSKYHQQVPTPSPPNNPLIVYGKRGGAILGIEQPIVHRPPGGGFGKPISDACKRAAVTLGPGSCA